MTDKIDTISNIIRGALADNFEITAEGYKDAAEAVLAFLEEQNEGISEWAAFSGMADNPAYTMNERLMHAKRANHLLELELLKVSHAVACAGLKVDEEAPKGWRDLIAALTLLSKGAVGNDPTHCEHDELTVCADPSKFNRADIELLDELGFSAGDEAFTSFRFGSA